MGKSYVAIANMALGHLGEDDTISSPDEESRAARVVATHWDTTRLVVLEEAAWSFASRTVELVQRADDPKWPIALNRKPFPLPADLVTLAEIVDPNLNDDDDEFAIEGGPSGTELLVEDDGPITIRYVRDGADIADPMRWSAAFVTAFAFRLAWQIADGMAADKGRKDRALNSYNSAILKAQRANARTKPFRRNPRSDWARARHSGRSRYDRPERVG
jgi:hypothetical protein